MQTSTAIDGATGRPALVRSTRIAEPDQPRQPQRRCLPMKQQREYSGLCDMTVYRIHANEQAAGREGVLLKVGRSTLLDVQAWERYLARQPRPVIRQRAAA